MSAPKRAQRLQLECGPSPILRGLYLFFAVLSLGCITLLPLALLPKCLMGLLLVAAAAHCWLRRCELGAPPVSLIWDADGHWWWLQGGEERECHLSEDSYLATGLLILNFYQSGSRRRCSLVLLPGSVGAAAFRRLSVRLRLAGRQNARGPAF